MERVWLEECETWFVQREPFGPIDWELTIRVKGMNETRLEADTNAARIKCALRRVLACELCDDSIAEAK